MITLLDTIGPAILHASWQASALAIVVMLLVRLLGERVSPRWRHRLWSIVVIRLLLVVAPASPWSAFNLVRLMPEASGPRVVERQAGPISVAGRPASPPAGALLSAKQTLRDIEPETSSPAPAVAARAISPTTQAAVTSESTPAADDLMRTFPIMRIVTMVWLAGCVLMGLQLMRAAIVLRRRLSVCRRVTDEVILFALEAARRQLGLNARVQLLVTPEPISPCIVGTLRPKIIVPESLITESSVVKLRHVLAHELAHIVRGDLWTNWLLLVAGTLHWFNPVAWWSIREMQAEREAACDDLALAATGETDRSAYASTIVDLAASLAPSGIAPAMIGLISSTRRLTKRIKRLVRTSSVTSLRAPMAAGIILAIGLAGLTDAMPAVMRAQAPAKRVRVPAKADQPEATTVTLSGRCVDWVDKTPIAGATVHLFKAQGRTAPIVEAAKAVTNHEGRFEIPAVPAPRDSDPFDPLFYLVFVEADDRPIGVEGFWNARGSDIASIEIGILREKTTLAGTVQDAQGRPVAGATIAQWAVDGRPIPGILSATTGPDGRFLINRIPHYEWLRGGATNRSGLSFTVSRRGYVETQVEVRELPKNITITLETGCRVTGMVIDGGTGRPAAGVLVLAQRLGEHPSETPASTDEEGRFEMALAEDQYNFCVRAKDRVCVALKDRECLAGAKVELPPFKLSSGGFISGQVVNAKTGEPITATEQGHAIAVGLIGPATPDANGITPLRMATVDRNGRYTLRTAAGENFPYFVTLQGDRMAWNTTKQPAVVVKEGETTHYNMLVTPRLTPEEKMNAARKVVAALSIKPVDRTSQILAEFRKLSHTVDEEELWCSLMRELVALGPQAVPQVCDELDRSTEDRTLRRLGFALRAIGDPRAVPALIRAIPKTLQPSSSDYGLIVADAAIAEFMQKNDLRDRPVGRGRYFDFGRPEREISGALQKLTGQNFDDSELFGLSRSDDPHRQSLQRRLFMRQARRWQTWWEEHWRDFVSDAAYQKVNFPAQDEPIIAAPTVLGPKAHTENHTIGAVLSPAAQEGQYTEYFTDLDTGAHPSWPTHIPRDEGRFDLKQLAAWAEKSGVDLMCMTHRAPDGTETFVLRSFGMRAWEISGRDLRKFDMLIASGTLPKGHDVRELLVHFDEESKQTVPDANAAFIYVTREGSMGLIETTDRVTQTADMTGMPAGNAPAGVGFKKGVRFNLKSIVP